MGRVIVSRGTTAALAVAISMALLQASCGGRSSADETGSESGREGDDGSESPDESSSCSDDPRVVFCTPPEVLCRDNPYVANCVGPYPSGKVPCMENPYIVDCIGPYPEGL